MKNAIFGWMVVVLLAGAGCGKKAEPGGGGASHGAGGAREGGDAHEGEKHEGEGHEGEAAEVVELAPEAVRNAQIATVEAVERAMATVIKAPARIEFSQTGVARVAPRVPGMLDQISVKLGQAVKKGAVLGWIESPELGRAHADFLAAVTHARVADDNFRREKELLAKGITSEREMREAETAAATARGEVIAAEARLHTLGLTDDYLKGLRLDDHPSARFPARSPLDGTVVEIAGTMGQSVESTTHLFTVGDLSVLRVVLDLAESQLQHVSPGQTVDVVVEAIPGKKFQGKVEYVGDVVEVQTRTTEVRVSIPNPDRTLKPGMFATAEVTVQGKGEGAPRRVVVPKESLQVLGDGLVVFVPDGENRFRPVRVVTGADSGREVEVVAGLKPGARVVTSGAFVLKSQLSKASLGEGDGHGH